MLNVPGVTEVAVLAPVAVATEEYTISKKAVSGIVFDHPAGGVNTFVAKL